MLAEAQSTRRSWLVDTASTEIGAQRLVFLFVLGPLLGYWMPALMFSMGIAIVMVTIATSAGYGEQHGIIETLPWVVGFSLPLITIAIGLLREQRRLAIADKDVDASGLLLPERQGAILRDRYGAIWRDLAGTAEQPRLICAPRFGITAHAYEGSTGRAIEISSGLASRVVRDDPVALSILRHEVAHLVYRDLPAIRRQSLIGGAAIFSADCAMAICLLATVIIVCLTDFRPFPVTPTIANIVLVHLAILLATLIVVLPLLLGRYVVRRYAGFLVALAEMRADVSAGIWGAGLSDFSERLDQDPTVRGTTMLDQGLSYISTGLSHFSGRERIALLRQPARLATPKLRYFAAAIFCTWFLQFHQGSQGWDVLLLANLVALLQGLTFAMLLRSAGNLEMPAMRAASLAFGVLAVQALPLINIEGLAFLTMHLTAALVSPGGFGPADSDFLSDTIVTIREFVRFTVAALGGWGFLVAIGIAASCYLAISRSRRVGSIFQGRTSSLTVVAIVSACSLCVSYKFFQSPLGNFAESVAFGLSGPEGEGLSGYPFGRNLNQQVSQLSLRLSDRLGGPPILESVAWLRLVLPQILGVLVMLAVFGVHAVVRRLRRALRQVFDS